MALTTSKQTRAHVGSSDPQGRPASDFYQTPPEATRALLSVEEIAGTIWEPACGAGAISRVLESAGCQVISTDLYAAVFIVEDRTVGTPLGAFATRTQAQVCVERALLDAPERGGYIRILEQWYDYGTPDVDFLTCEVPAGVTSIVTNPPFTLAEEFALRGVAVIARTGGTMALMQRLAWLETPDRACLFKGTGLSHVWILSRRIPLMHRPGYLGKKATSSIPFAWFIWRAGYVGSPTIGWVDWKDPGRPRTAAPAARNLFAEAELCTIR